MLSNFFASELYFLLTVCKEMCGRDFMHMADAPLPMYLFQSSFSEGFIIDKR